MRWPPLPKVGDPAVELGDCQEERPRSLGFAITIPASFDAPTFPFVRGHERLLLREFVGAVVAFEEQCSDCASELGITDNATTTDLMEHHDRTWIRSVIGHLLLPL
jgi:hypothetical protein